MNPFAAFALRYWWVAALAALVLAVGVQRGQLAKAHDDLKVAEATMKAQAKVAARVKTAGAITTDVGAKAETRSVEIRWRTRTTIKEVPVYVTAETDRRFAVPVGLVRLHDAAAAGVDPATLPDPAGRPDDAPSGVAASTFGATVVDNYGTCREQLEKFAQLQSWIEQQRAAWDRP